MELIQTTHTPPTHTISNSYLDNIETFRHFSKNPEKYSTNSADFYTLYYRRKNLQLKHKLEQSSLAYNPTIQTAVKSLACCSCASLVDLNSDTGYSIGQTSARCRSRYCLICSKIKSTQLTKNFINSISKAEHKDWFVSRHFYLITYTLKHDLNTRTYNYMSELKTYIDKFLRSKVIKQIFQVVKPSHDYGGFYSTELTIGKNGHHIHCHMLICSKPLKRPIVEVARTLKNKWFELTGDSDQIDIQLVKSLHTADTGDQFNPKSSINLSAVSEVFKYAVKPESLTHLNENDIESFANFVIQSKGKNFISSFGYFRKLKLTEKQTPSVKDPSNVVESHPEASFLCPTSHILTSVPIWKSYPRKITKELSKVSKVSGFELPPIDVTEIRDVVLLELKSKIDNTNVDQIILSITELAKSQNDWFDQVSSIGNTSNGWFKNSAVDDEGFSVSSSV